MRILVRLRCMPLSPPVGVITVLNRRLTNVLAQNRWRCLSSVRRISCSRSDDSCQPIVLKFDHTLRVSLLTYLRKGLVSANSLGPIKIAVNTRVDLVQEVLGVRSSSVGRRARARAEVRRARSTGSSTVVTVRVDSGVCGVGNTRVVRSVSASWVVVAGGWVAVADTAGGA